jgi:hypothetical protein
MIKNQTRLFPFLLQLVLCVSILAGCSLPINFLPDSGEPSAPIPPNETLLNYQQAEVYFLVTPPTDLAEGSKLAIEIIDEVTGIVYNPIRYPLERNSDGLYSVHLPIAVGSVVKYRYLREDVSLIVEATLGADPVRFRTLVVSGPTTVSDTIFGWSDAPYLGSVGRIEGVVKDANGVPIPDILVSASGLSTFTAGDGSYRLINLPVGLHLLTFLSIDGNYVPYQQGALVDANATTPADISLNAPQKVIVTFILHPPEEQIPDIPIYILGNIASLGYTYADLRNGVTTLSSRAVRLTSQQDGRYAITLALPAGLDLRYKYSIGDGLWNAEHQADGLFRTRQLIVPNHDVVIEDVVATWKAGEFGPISFTVHLPENTPPSDQVSIQLNPGDWSEPLPMWSLGDNTWLYVLYSPYYLFDQISYRYCRNDICLSENDVKYSRSNDGLGSISAQVPAQDFQDTISAWQWWSPETTDVIVPPVEIAPRDAKFITGFELLPYYHPGLSQYWKLAGNQISSLQGNTVIFTPTWTVGSPTNPNISFVPNTSPFWQDLIAVSQSANANNLKIGYYPQLAFHDPVSTWWKDAPRDYAWWVSWFDAYHTFLIHHARLAQQTGASFLVIGDTFVSPSYPNGHLSNGDSANLPPEFNSWWERTIIDIRQEFGGSIYAALPYSGKEAKIPDWMLQSDGIYLLYNVKLSDESTPPLSQLIKATQNNIKDVLQPMQETWHLPVIIALSYPSADGASAGCISQKDSCINFRDLSRPQDDIPSVALDLQEQVDLYNAIFTATQDLDWLIGYSSRGYYPGAVLQDKSSSIHGKPAGDVIWYWYGKFQNK